MQYESKFRSTKLHGRSLWFARGAWTAVLLLVLSIVAANLPDLLDDTRQEWIVTEALFAGRSIFPSIETFVAYVAALRLIAALVFFGVALFLAWRKSDDWMVLFTSAALMVMIYLFGFTMNIDVIRYPALLEEAFPAIHFLFPLLIIGRHPGTLLSLSRRDPLPALDCHLRPVWPGRQRPLFLRGIQSFLYRGLGCL